MTWTDTFEADDITVCIVLICSYHPTFNSVAVIHPTIVTVSCSGVRNGRWLCVSVIDSVLCGLFHVAIWSL